MADRIDQPPRLSGLQGGVLLIATSVILVNLLVDVLYGVLNPRIRHAR